MFGETDKIMTKPSVIANRLSITIAELIIDYLFRFYQPGLGTSKQ